MLAREQLGRSEETLQRMAEEVERARACVGEELEGLGDEIVFFLAMFRMFVFQVSQTI